MKATRADNTALWPAIGQLIGEEDLTLRVSGQCMEPLLMDQAMVSLRKAKVYIPGDIVVVGRPTGPPVVHRLVGVFPSGGTLRYLTQADNSSTPDGSVIRDAILGKVNGGDCSPLALKVPLRHRVKAAHRFLEFLGANLKQRTWSFLKTT